MGYIGACGIFLALILLPSAFAATFTVTNLNDSGVGSLRQAIFDANTAGGGTIAFQNGLNGTITLIGGTLMINSNIIINGSGANVLAISGNYAWPAFFINSGVNSISGLTIKDGFSAGGGGGIVNNSRLTVSNSSLANNTAQEGGGILNNGTLTITNSTLSGNSALINGGGIANLGVLTITNSTISGNTALYNGGGIISGGLYLTITDSTISDNQASSAGGIRADSVKIGNSVLSGNSEDPSIYEKRNCFCAIFASLGNNLFGENGISGLSYSWLFEDSCGVERGSASF